MTAHEYTDLWVSSRPIIVLVLVLVLVLDSGRSEKPLRPFLLRIGVLSRDKVRFTYIFPICYDISMDHMFDHEKLDVYGVELAFIRWLTDFLEEVSEYPAAQRRELVDQLDRASLSALFNTAEGNGKRQGRQRAKFFDDARGSALECAACLDAAVAKRVATNDHIHTGKEMLARVVAMLTRLVERFDPDEFRVRDDTGREYRDDF
jgi:four helix bundle protein